ncbi:catalase-like [Anticarsia gemmatalis]|uniref:catalase-like n=1 Tax=Anticarsia gemmatalis TaxID=129554 RepID=UPI003F757409
MKTIIACIALLIFSAKCDKNSLLDNVTALIQPAARQLLDFKLEHPVPIGLWTKTSGEPTEIRDIRTVNSDQFNNQLFLDSQLTFDGERIPERVVHAKGSGAFGYLEVTNDVSKYTYAELFNGIGKRTPLVVRFSTAVQSLGGNDLGRELKGMAVKFYTKEGVLDLTCLQTPVYLYRDPILFPFFVRAFKRNPQTSLIDNTARWDMTTLRPILLHNLFWLFADYGVPNGYRRMDAFPIHTYEIANKKGESHYVRFNFRTEQGFSAIPTPQAVVIGGQDPDYYNRDLYNNIELGNFPAWRLEMDVMTKDNLKKVDFDPFDVTRLWKNGTFETVQIGRVVLNKNVENQFRDVEQGAFNPAHLVPGIPGPVDWLFRGRRTAYRDTQNYRLGRNHNKIFINMPLYAKTYNRDGRPPTRWNGRDAPNYYPNSFNGPAPYVDEMRPEKKLLTLESTAVDLEPCWYFYNYVLDNEAHRQRFVENIVLSLNQVTPPVLKRTLKLLYQVDHDLGRRVRIGVEIALAEAAAQQSATTPPPPPVPVTVPTVQGKCNDTYDKHH